VWLSFESDIRLCRISIGTEESVSADELDWGTFIQDIEMVSMADVVAITQTYGLWAFLSLSPAIEIQFQEESEECVLVLWLQTSKDMFQKLNGNVKVEERGEENATEPAIVWTDASLLVHMLEGMQSIHRRFLTPAVDIEQVDPDLVKKFRQQLLQRRQEQQKQQPEQLKQEPRQRRLRDGQPGSPCSEDEGGGGNGEGCRKRSKAFKRDIERVLELVGGEGGDFHRRFKLGRVIGKGSTCMVKMATGVASAQEKAHGESEKGGSEKREGKQEHGNREHGGGVAVSTAEGREHGGGVAVSTAEGREPLTEVSQFVSQYAVKCIPLTELRRTDRRAVMQEVVTLRRLQHPQIIRCIEVAFNYSTGNDSGDGSGDESVSSGVGTMYIVIDLMEGGDLFGNVQATVLLACLRLSSRRCITALY
jgi:hypothetical protein